MLLLNISKNRLRCHRGVRKSHMRIVSALQAKVFHLPYYNIDDIKKIYRFFMYDLYSIVFPFLECPFVSHSSFANLLKIR